MEGQSIVVTDLRLAYAATGADCEDGGGYSATLTPGEGFSVYVTVTVRMNHAAAGVHRRQHLLPRLALSQRRGHSATRG